MLGFSYGQDQICGISLNTSRPKTYIVPYRSPPNLNVVRSSFRLGHYISWTAQNLACESYEKRMLQRGLGFRVYCNVLSLKTGLDADRSKGPCTKRGIIGNALP